MLTAPGATEFAKIFLSFSSSEIVSMNLTTPALEDAYALKFGDGFVAPPPDN